MKRDNSSREEKYERRKLVLSCNCCLLLRQACYYDNLMRGLGDDLSTDSFDAVLEFANELANDGYFIKIKNVETGSEVHYDANVWLAAIENGDVPEDVYEVTM